MYVTNLNDMKTILTDYSGNFTIHAKIGDVIRFTSIIAERKDVKVTQGFFENPLNIFELKFSYHDIQEVVISNFKASGILKKDVIALNKKDKGEIVEKMIGLPKPKGNGLSPEQPIAAFANGGFSLGLNSIYEILSGERKKKERLYAYETMNSDITNIRNYFGDTYFEELKIPQNLINNFLQFVYRSDNLKPYLEAQNFESAKFSIEKYLPVYLKRLRNSTLTKLSP